MSSEEEYTDQEEGGSRRSGYRRWLVGGGLLLLLVVLAAGGLLGVLLVPSYREASHYDLEIIAAMADPQRADALPDADFAFLHGERPILLAFDEFPVHLRDALVAREDSRFWDHRGVDLVGVARAALINLRQRGFHQGAGTITMQVARTAYGFEARTLERKLLETMLALRIERQLSKQDILAAYMNWVFLGMDNHGFEQASREYFRKPAAALSLGECAVLVGMLRAPNRLDPLRHPQAAKRERDAVLQRMVAEGMLAEADARAAMSRPVTGEADESAR